MSKFTPGPWWISGIVVGTGDISISPEGGRFVVATAHNGCDFLQSTPDQQMANAKLIAAAPQLYEALGGLKRGNCFCDMAIGHPLHDRHSDACIKAKAALAAVEGK